MRVIVAGVFVFAALLGLVALAGALDIFNRAPPSVVGPAFVLFLFVLVAAALWLFNPKGSDRFGRRSTEEHLRDLERLDLLESTEFRVQRAFGVQEVEDEGLHYFLELDDGRVLFLSGQYLYDYEPIFDDPAVNQPRAFPCSEFIVRRHKRQRYVVEIRCGGVVLEPELIARPFGNKDGRTGRVPEDGQVIVDVSYEQLKRDRIDG